MGWGGEGGGNGVKTLRDKGGVRGEKGEVRGERSILRR